MRNALHEQLLKAGLVDEKRLEESEREKRRERAAPNVGAASKKPRHHPRQSHPPPLARPAPRAPSKAELEAARQAQQAARRSLEREIVQLIKAERKPHNDGDEVYNFVDGRKIGRIYVTPAMHAMLSRGELAIVRLRTRYAVVPTTTAAGIAEKAPEFVVMANQDAERVPEDPAYTEHPIPDDLRW